MSAGRVADLGRRQFDDRVGFDQASWSGMPRGRGDHASSFATRRQQVAPGFHFVRLPLADIRSRRRTECHHGATRRWEPAPPLIPWPWAVGRGLRGRRGLRGLRGLSGLRGRRGPVNSVGPVGSVNHAGRSGRSGRSETPRTTRNIGVGARPSSGTTTPVSGPVRKDRELIMRPPAASWHVEMHDVLMDGPVATPGETGRFHRLHNFFGQIEDALASVFPECVLVPLLGVVLQ